MGKATVLLWDMITLAALVRFSSWTNKIKDYFGAYFIVLHYDISLHVGEVWDLVFDSVVFYLNVFGYGRLDTFQ